MKKIYLLFTIIILISTICYSQDGNWKVLTIQRELFSINFVTQEKGWIFGGDYAYKTSDMGRTWSNPIKMDPRVGSSGGSFYVYPDYISFIDSLYGWACQSNNVLLKTNNGGVSWNSVNTNLNNCEFFCVHFLNRQKGWVGGRNSQGFGVISKTTNGGANWVNIVTNFRFPVTSLAIINENKAFILYAYDTIAVTNNNWTTWNKIKVGNGQGTKRIIFNDSLNGWVLGFGYPQYISRTTNGGMNWDVHTYPDPGNSLNFYFLNSLTGWIIGSFGTVQKTTNGGVNWSLLRGYQGGSPNYDLYDVYFADANTGWISAFDGAVLKSTNGGINWNKMISPPLGNVVSIDFCDLNTGYILTRYLVGNDDASHIWRTTNRGYSWTTMNTFSNIIFTSLDFVDDNIGYACGNSGKIYKTTNAGVNFVNISVGNSNYNSVSFLDNNTGFICGSGGSIFSTTNGGINWINLQSNTTKKLNDICVVDPQNIYIAADSGYILKSTNSGGNWSLLYPFNNKTYNKIHFINNETGFATGRSIYTGIPPTAFLVVIKTTNGGVSWTRPLEEGLYISEYYNDIFFLNNEKGWLLTSEGLKKTTNGGINWFPEQLPINSGLTCMKFINENSAWIGGNSGTILSTSSPIGIQNISSEMPDRFLLSQNYPNPFNPQTKIKFDVPANVKGQTSNVKLIVYDLLGREVATLVNEQLKPGTYEADWDGSNFSSGVYFYRIVSGDYSETKKMVLMK